MMLRKTLFFSLVLLFSLWMVSVGQSLQDIQNVKVDALSDAQIEQLIRRAESAGMNEQQLEAMARERGMPFSEISKLRKRIQSLQSGRNNMQDTRNRPFSQERGRQVMGMQYDPDIFDSLRRSDPYYDLTEEQKKIFGFTLFHNRELDFTPNLNLPTPPSYELGSGDQLLIDIYGASQQNYDLTINPEGRVFIPNVGPVEVGGSSVEVASSRIIKSLERIYSGMGGSNPNTFMQLRVGNIRTIKVTLAGELRKPGSYSIPSFSSVFNALYAAGGPNERGSFRSIQVYRGSKLVQEVDIYAFLISGNMVEDMILRDNDIIIVPPITSRVEIEGPVRRPGLFELKSGETIQDMLKFAGGFSSEAYGSLLTVHRRTEKELKIDNVSESEFETFLIKDGDQFKVGELLKRYENRIQVSGAVFRPGEFAMRDKMTLSELIDLAEGLRGDAYTKRATLYRTKADFTMEILSVDLDAILDGRQQDIPLKREDILNVPSIYDLKEEYYVRISGEVNRTGVYQYGKQMTVGDLVVKARGFKESASNSMIEIARRVKDDSSGKIAEILTLTIDNDLNLTEEEKSITLMPFDHVFVRKSLGFQRDKLVEVKGEVNYPGEFSLEKRDERISDVIKRAGGINQFAYLKGATLIRRTEHYDDKGDNQKKLENLESLLSNMDRDEAVDNAETEKQLLDRIERRVELLREERMKDLQGRREKDSFVGDRYTLLEGTDSSVVQIAMREHELIGIESEKIIQFPGSKYDLILQEGDVISVPKELQTVRMRGEVLYPTTARFEELRGFRNYISRAGGFTEEARKGRSYVVYANGDVKRTNKFLFFTFFPNVEPGAEIIVPKKPERQPISPQVWVTIGTSLATMGLIISQIININMN